MSEWKFEPWFEAGERADEMVAFARRPDGHVQEVARAYWVHVDSVDVGWYLGVDVLMDVRQLAILAGLLAQLEPPA